MEDAPIDENVLITLGNPLGDHCGGTPRCPHAVPGRDGALVEAGGWSTEGQRRDGGDERKYLQHEDITEWFQRSSSSPGETSGETRDIVRLLIQNTETARVVVDSECPEPGSNHAVKL